jgi:hypothetical protein
MRLPPVDAGAVGKWAGQLAGYAVATMAITFILLRPSGRGGKRGSLFLGSGILVVLMKTLLSTGGTTEANPVPAAPVLAAAAPVAPAPAPVKRAANPPAVTVTPRAQPAPAQPVQPSPAAAKPAPAKPKPPAAAPAVVASKPPPPPLGLRYADRDSGYSIQFPEGWTYKRSPEAGWLLDATDDQSGVISIGFARFPANVTIDQVSADRVTKGLQKRTGTVVHSCGYATLAGRRCLWHKFTGPVTRRGATTKVTAVHYFLPLQDGRALEVRLSATPDKFKELAPRMKQSVDTLKLLTRVADAG